MNLLHVPSPILRVVAFAASLSLAVTVAQEPDPREPVGPGEFRTEFDLTPAALQAIVADGFRVTDLEVAQADPLLLSATLVRNEGVYARQSWWDVGLDVQGVQSRSSARSARVVDLEYYSVQGRQRVACVMQERSGGPAAGVVYNVDRARMDAVLANPSNRPVDLERWEQNGTTLYSAVLVGNSGAWQRNWEHHLDVPWSTLQARLAAGYRVYEIDPLGGDRYDAVLVAASWGYTFGLNYTPSQVLDSADQFAHRASDIDRIPGAAGSRYTYFAHGNVGPVEARVEALMRGLTADGTIGYFCREIGGREVASRRARQVFEPASSLKLLHHLAAMRAVSRGTHSLQQPVSVFTSKRGSCPTGSAPVTEDLSTVLRKTMERSDNCRTLAVEQLLGRAALQATADDLGALRFELRHVIGCGGPLPNRATLEGFYALHAAVENGYLGSQREAFYEHMLNDLGFGGIDARIANAAASAGLSTDETAAFRSLFEVARKGGSYGVPHNGSFLHHRSLFARVVVPFQVNGVLELRPFAVGSYVDSASDGNDAIQAAWQAIGSLLEDEILAAARSWAGGTLRGFVRSYGQGCLTSTGRPHAQLVGGTPMIGARNYVEYISTNTAPGLPTILQIGFSSTVGYGVALPFDLAPVGAPGCSLLCDGSISLGLVADPIGTVRFRFQGIPAAFAGRSLYTQWISLVSGNNPAGVSTSNAYETFFGGL